MVATGPAAAPSREALFGHRGFVGQPQRYDVMAASQFAMLFHLGLRERHRLLDFGCGSLRLGRLLIPYLAADRYFGVEPEQALVEAGFDHELGHDVRALKRPRFDHNRDWRVDGFGERFDYIIAQSVFSHTGAGPTARGLKAFAGALAPGGLVIANWLLGPEGLGPPVETTDWVYPECVAFAPDRIERLAAEAGLATRALPWPHPGLHWFVLARDPADLPSLDRLRAMNIPAPDWDG